MGNLPVVSNRNKEGSNLFNNDKNDTFFVEEGRSKCHITSLLIDEGQVGLWTEV